MTIASIQQALMQGYSISTVIQSILKMDSPLAKSIKEAIKQGYNEDQIGEYLSKGKNLSFSQKNKMLKGMTEEEKARGIAYHQTKSEKNIGNLVKSAAISGGAAAAGSFAAPALGGALARAAPSLLGPGAIPGALSGVQGALGGAQPQAPQAPQAPVAPVSQGMQEPIDEGEKLRQDIIAKSQQNRPDIEPKKGPSKFIEQEKNRLESEYGPLEPAPGIEEPKPITKHQTVATPIGMGKVLEIRIGLAIVEDDNGKKHKIPEEELISSPLPEKDLAELYEDLVGGIEKKTGQQVSRNVEWAGYDPKTNELAYKPHGSDRLYAYGDIEPEDVEQLTSLLTQRKTTGENFIGAWEAGTASPIGAAMHALIMKLQKTRGGKGNEYKNRYETLYDALEPAKKALKERHAERKKQAKKPRSR